jgi:hypothetical protein
VVLASRCGYSTDYSGPVNDRAMLHIDNCYYLPNLHIVGHRCKTNMQSATAFRGFGGPQGMFGIETVIEDIAHQLGKDPLDVRRINLYQDPALSGDPGSHDHAVQPGDRGLDRPTRSSTSWRPSPATAPAASRCNAFNASQPPASGPGPGAAEVRHQLHRHHAEPGRRAGACLPGRLGQ